MSRKKILLVMTRHPTPGRCKTRLTPPLTPEEGAVVQDAMIRDAARSTGDLSGVEVRVVHTPSDASPYFRERFPHARLFPQEGGDLGERLSHAFQTAFRDGGSLVCAVGTDTPRITPDQLREAFGRLDTPTPTAVVGPARDGGYWLIGMNRFFPPLFRGIPWGGPEVFRTTLLRAGEAGVGVSLLPEMDDIDTADDLRSHSPAGPYGGETAAVALTLGERLR